MARGKKVTEISKIRNFGLNLINFIISRTYYHNIFKFGPNPKKFEWEGFMASLLYIIFLSTYIPLSFDSF